MSIDNDPFDPEQRVRDDDDAGDGRDMPSATGSRRQGVGDPSAPPKKKPETPQQRYDKAAAENDREFSYFTVMVSRLHPDTTPLGLLKGAEAPSYGLLIEAMRSRGWVRGDAEDFQIQIRDQGNKFVKQVTIPFAFDALQKARYQEFVVAAQRRAADASAGRPVEPPARVAGADDVSVRRVSEDERARIRAEAIAEERRHVAQQKEREVELAEAARRRAEEDAAALRRREDDERRAREARDAAAAAAAAAPAWANPTNAAPPAQPAAAPVPPVEATRPAEQPRGPFEQMVFDEVRKLREMQAESQMRERARDEAQRILNERARDATPAAPAAAPVTQTAPAEPAPPKQFLPALAKGWIWGIMPGGEYVPLRDPSLPQEAAATSTVGAAPQQAAAQAPAQAPQHVSQQKNGSPAPTSLVDELEQKLDDYEGLGKQITRFSRLFNNGRTPGAPAAAAAAATEPVAAAAAAPAAAAPMKLEEEPEPPYIEIPDGKGGVRARLVKDKAGSIDPMQSVTASGDIIFEKVMGMVDRIFAPRPEAAQTGQVTQTPVASSTDTPHLGRASIMDRAARKSLSLLRTRTRKPRR